MYILIFCDPTSAPEYPSVALTRSSISTSVFIGVWENFKFKIARLVSELGSDT